MGHFHTTVTGIGANRQEAERDAIDQFFHEEGHRHSLREVLKPTLLERVPPTRTVEKVMGRNILMSSEPDPTAPMSEWLEKWQFELHTHA